MHVYYSELTLYRFWSKYTVICFCFISEKKTDRDESDAPPTAVTTLARVTFSYLSMQNRAWRGSVRHRRAVCAYETHHGKSCSAALLRRDERRHWTPDVTAFSVDATSFPPSPLPTTWVASSYCVMWDESRQQLQQLHWRYAITNPPDNLLQAQWRTQNGR